MKNFLKNTIAFLLIACAGLVLGCDNFDRDTFNTLSVSQAVLTQAQNDYEAGTLPHTACVQKIINDGKSTQAVAVAAFGAYYRVEQAKGDTAATEYVVIQDLADLAPVVTQIKALYTNPTCTTAVSAPTAAPATPAY